MPTKQKTTKGAAVETEEETRSFTPADLLIEQGIGRSDVLRLIDAGFRTMESLYMASSRQLIEAKGISDNKAAKIIEQVNKWAQETGHGIMTGNEYAEKRKSVRRIPSGVEAVDTLLGGGFESMSITELFGEFRTGKTQICHTLAVQAVLNGGRAVYVDTEGTFRPERINQIAEEHGVKGSDVLDNIICARAYNHEQQLQLLNLISAKMAEDGRFLLLIVDSVTALFRVDFSGRGQLSERQQVLGQYLSRLSKIADEFNVAVVLTNQVTADPGAVVSFGPAQAKPIGGNIMAHASTTRLYLRKGRAGGRVMKIYDSPTLPEGEANYIITAAGISEHSG